MGVLITQCWILYYEFSLLFFESIMIRCCCGKGIKKLPADAAVYYIKIYKCVDMLTIHASEELRIVFGSLHVF
jgi:hypothetical protein